MMSIIEEEREYIGERAVFPHFDEWEPALAPNLSIVAVVRVFQKVPHPENCEDGLMEWCNGRPPEMLFLSLELEELRDNEIPGVTIPDAARKFLVARSELWHESGIEASQQRGEPIAETDQRV